MKTKALAAILGALLLALAGTAIAHTAGAASAGPALTLHKTPFGKVIFNGSDRALYLFGRDKGGKSSCYGSCAKAWPPYIVKSKPSARSGVNSGLVGTTRRKDGKLQVTYGGHPLYFYSADPKGKAKCQKVVNSGGIWLVVNAAGKAVR